MDPEYPQDPDDIADQMDGHGTRAHDLAQKLLAGPDLPVEMSLRCGEGNIFSEGEEIKVVTQGGRVVLSAYVEDTKFGYIE